MPRQQNHLARDHAQARATAWARRFGCRGGSSDLAEIEADLAAVLVVEHQQIDARSSGGIVRKATTTSLRDPLASRISWAKAA